MRNLGRNNTAHRRLNKQIKFLTALERYGCDWVKVSELLGLTVSQVKKYYIIVNNRFERERREEMRRKVEETDSQECEDCPRTRSIGVQYGEGLYLPGWRKSLL